jgi:Flp pilus assembly protein TadG
MIKNLISEAQGSSSHQVEMIVGRESCLQSPAARSHRPRASGGQSLVEFALISVPLLLLLLGLIDFGILFEKQVAQTNAARAGGRYASLHPSALSSLNPAPSNSIQGQIQGAGDSGALPNDDAHLTITYYPAGSTTSCGTYSQASSAVVYTGGYTQATCLAVGSSVKVQVQSTYPVLTPMISNLFPSGVMTTAISAFLIEQYP